MTVPVNSVAEGSCIADIGGNMGFGGEPLCLLEEQGEIGTWRHGKTLRSIASGRAGGIWQKWDWPDHSPLLANHPIRSSRLFWSKQHVYFIPKKNYNLLPFLVGSSMYPRCRMREKNRKIQYRFLLWRLRYDIPWYWNRYFGYCQVLREKVRPRGIFHDKGSMEQIFGRIKNDTSLHQSFSVERQHRCQEQENSLHCGWSVRCLSFSGIFDKYIFLRHGGKREYID